MSEFFHRFSWVDLVILILLIRTAYVGGTAGLATELFKAAGLLVGLVAGFRYYGVLAASSRRWAGPLQEVYLQIVFFLAILIVAAFAFRILRTMTASVAKVTFVTQLEKYGGLAVGIARGLVIASLLLFAAGLVPNELFRESLGLDSSPRPQGGAQNDRGVGVRRDRGLLAPVVAKIAPGVYEGLGRVVPVLAPSPRPSPQRGEGMLDPSSRTRGK